VVATRAPLTGVRRDASGRVESLIVGATEGDIEVRTRAVVNAGGVWADDVRAVDEGTNPGTLRPAKGIHLTFTADRFPVHAAVIVPAPDKRSLFAVPWGAFTYVGTTDTDWDGSLDDPYCTPDDVDYLLSAMNRFTGAGLRRDDVTGTWAGLRPLVRSTGSAKTADLSRRHQVQVAPSGVVTVTGGKLTTYRRMAEEAIDTVVQLLGGKERSRTAKLRLLGAPDAPIEPEDHLAGRYGTEAPLVRSLADERPELAEPLVPGLPYLAAEAVWAVRHEQAVTLADVLERRTRARLLDLHATVSAAPAVAVLLATELGWDVATRDRQIADFQASAAREWSAAGLPDPHEVHR
jgi:glycerol-3-phosphate dehydrogenase